MSFLFHFRLFILFYFSCVFFSSLLLSFTKRMKVATVICSLIAITCSFSANFWCRTILLGPTSTFRSNNYPTLYFGVWTQLQTQVNIGSGSTIITTGKKCTRYSSDVNIDSYWKAARAFSIIAPVLGLMLVCSTLVTEMDKNQSRTIGILILVFVTLSQGLTLLIFRSSACQGSSIFGGSGIILDSIIMRAFAGGCIIGPGTYISLVAIIFWIFTGISVMSSGSD